MGWFTGPARRQQGKAPAVRPPRALGLLALEPRLMFDGALAASAAHGLDAASPHPADLQRHVADAAPPAASPPARHEVIFVDPAVQNYQQLIAAVPAGREIVVLDPSRDGFAQMAQYLAGRQGLSAIELISHGDSAGVQAGSVWLTGQTLAQHTAQLQAIGAALAPGGDLLLYGCDVAAGPAGQALVNRIAAITGADVAASTDDTGNAALGGNWVLEDHTGPIETGLFAPLARLQAYQGLLTVPADENYDSDAGFTVTGNTFTLDGIKYTITGNPGPYTNVTDNSPGDSPLSSNATDYFLLFDKTSNLGISSIKIEAADGSAFELASLSIDAAADTNITITPSSGSAVSFSSNGLFVTRENYDLSGNTSFQNITSFTISGGNLTLNLDDLNFEPAVIPNASPVDTTSGGSTAWTEGNNVTSTPVVVDSGFTVTDSDNSTLASATVSITGNLHTAEDSLAFVNNGSTMGNITGSYTAGTGVLALGSSGATATLAQWQAALRSITYTDSSNTPNTSSRTISFITNDGNSDGNTATKTVSLSAVDDTPVVSTSGGSSTFNQGNNTAGTPVAVDSGITVSDLDNSTLASATVSITGNLRNAEDVLAFTNTNAATFGNVTASFDSSLGVLTLNSAGATATVAQWQAALRSVTYSDSAASPDTSTRTVSFLVNDGSVASSAATRQVTVTSTDNTPVDTTSGGSTTWLQGNNTTSTPVIVDGSFTVSDLDNSTLASATVAITGNFHASEDVLAFTNDGATMGNISALYDASTGALSLSSSGATATLAQWQQALRSVSYTDSATPPNTASRTISFTTNDGTADGNTATKTVIVTAVDQSPILATGSSGSAAWTETAVTASTPVAVDGGLTLSDADNTTLASARVAISGNLQNAEDVLAFSNTSSASFGNITAGFDSSLGVLSLTSAGATATLAQWQAALRAVSYNDSSHNPDTGTRTISFTVNDGSSDSNSLARTVTLSAADDPPVLSGFSGAVTFTENGGSVTLAGSGTLSDADNSTLASATVSISGNFTAGEDTLSVGTPGGLAVSYNASTGILSLSGTASLATYRSALRSVRYTDSSANPGTADRTISWVVNDGSADSIASTSTVHVIAVDSPPTDTTSGGSTAWTKGSNGSSTPVAVDSGFTVSDPDNSTLASATVAISGGLHAGQDVLAFVNDGSTMGDIAASYNVGTGVLTLISGSGTASLAQWQSALRSVTYNDSSLAPDTTDRTLTFTTNDGSADGNSATKTVTLTSINDSPVNTLPGSQTVSENSLLVFSSATGNQILVNDADSLGATEKVTLTATQGTLTLGSTANLSFLTGSGTGDTTMSFEGTLSAINAALDFLLFTPTPGYHGAASLQILSDDLGNSGGPAQTDSGTISIDVASIAPVVTEVASFSADGSYKAGDTLDLSVSFDRTVTVTGTPLLVLSDGGTARYVTGSGGHTLDFQYTVAAGEHSNDLDYASSAALSLNGGSIQGGGNAADLTLAAPGAAHSLGDNSSLVIDGIAPTVASVGVPADGTYVAGQALDFSVNTTEPVFVDTSGGAPRIALTLDTGGVVFASYVSGSGTSALLFRATVASGESDGNGIAVAGSIDANGGSLRDAAGNDASLALAGLPSTAGIRVDAVAPVARGLVAANGGGLTNAAAVDFNLSFSEPVSGVDATDFSLATTGTVSGHVSSVSDLGRGSYLIHVDQLAGTGTLGLQLLAAGNGVSSIADLAGNPLAGSGLPSSQVFSIDRDAPVISSIGAPPDGSYRAGQVLSFTVATSEAVIVDSGGGTPRLQLVLGGGSAGVTRYADYSSGSGGSSLTFSYTVQAGDTLASGGISVAALQTQGGSLRDAAGNDLVATLHAVAPASGVIVDTTPPSASWSLLDAPGSAAPTLVYEFKTSEPVSGVSAADFAVVTGSGSASGAVTGVQQIDATTWRVTVGNVQGAGSVNLALSAAAATAIVDPAGNALVAPGALAPHQVDTLAVVPPPIRVEPLPPPVVITVPIVPTPPLVLGLVPDTLAPPRGEAIQPLVPGPAIEPVLILEPAPLQVLPDLGVQSVVGAGQALNISMPLNAFFASAGEPAQLSFRASLSDSTPLPAWLNFDATTGRLTGQPPAGYSGVLDIQLTARDARGNTASTVIHIDIQAPPAQIVPKPLLPPKPARPISGRPGLDAQFAQLRGPSAASALMRSRGQA